MPSDEKLASGILLSMPCAVVLVRQGKIAYSFVPKSLGGDGALDGIGAHVLKCSKQIAGSGKLPPLLHNGRHLSFECSRHNGSLLAIATDTSSKEIYIRQLRKRIDSLEKFRGMAVNRELRMMELKREIEALKKSLEGANG